MKKIVLLLCLFISPVIAFSQGVVKMTPRYDTTENGFVVPNYDKIGQYINDKNSEFYYPKLVKRFAKADTTLSFDALYSLYYGYVLQSDYNPYINLDEEDDAREILKKENVSKKEAKKAMKYLDKAIKKVPVHLPLYYYRYIACTIVYGGESMQAAEDAARYVALLNVISSTGDGQSYETAFHVTMVTHSYNLMSYFGFQPKMQSLSYEDGQAYDIFELEDNNYNLESLYFNVNTCLNYLGKKIKE